jgi:hypothetical protein
MITLEILTRPCVKAEEVTRPTHNCTATTCCSTRLPEAIRLFGLGSHANIGKTSRTTHSNTGNTRQSEKEIEECLAKQTYTYEEPNPENNHRETAFGCFKW